MWITVFKKYNKIVLSAKKYILKFTVLLTYKFDFYPFKP